MIFTPCALASSTIDMTLFSGVLELWSAGVAGDVVDATQDVDSGGLEGEHVRLEAEQHLRRSLPADGVLDAGRAEKIRVRKQPALRDRIVPENDAGAISGQGGDLRVVDPAVAEVGPVIGALAGLHFLIGRAVFGGDGRRRCGAAKRELGADGRDDGGQDHYRWIAMRSGSAVAGRLITAGGGAGVAHPAGVETRSAKAMRFIILTSHNRPSPANPPPFCGNRTQLGLSAVASR